MALTHSFSFPLAEVAAAVILQCPDLGPCLLAKLHQVLMPLLHTRTCKLPE